MKRTRIVFVLIIGAVIAVIAISLLSRDSSTALATATAESLEQRYQKGIGYVNLGRWQDARQELEIVFETDPTYKDVQAKLKEAQDQLALLRPAAPVPGSTWTRPEDNTVMVYVPGGNFGMGSNSGERNEQPVHTVTLDGFWLDQTEVSNAQYAAFVNAQGNQSEGAAPWLDLADEDCRIKETGGRYQPQDGYADRPLVEVSWYGASAYCQWVGGRLPSEAEWESPALHCAAHSAARCK